MMMAALALAVAVALGLVLAAPADAQDKPRLSREQALRDLTSPDVEARRLATAWLGELATPADLPALFKQLRDPDDLVRALTENSIWQVWSRSGDTKVDALFSVGVEQMNQGQAQAAIDTFTDIIRLKPDFAEGWNKRATIYFLIGEYDKSLSDCDEVIKRNPQHWGALSGYGQIYVQLDKPEQALVYFQRALAVNPNLQQVENMIQQLKQVVIEKRKGTI
jgi:tetratricopeptide (TPR) repeat protein